MTKVFVISLQTLLEGTLADPLEKHAEGNIRAIEDLFSSENRNTLKQHFPGVFAFLAFHPGADNGITSYIRSGSLSSDSGQNILVLFTFDSGATSPTLLRDQAFRAWLALTTAVHPSYTLVRSMFKDPVALNFPGVIFFEDFLQEQNPVYVHISDSSNEDACNLNHFLANRDPHMLQNESGIICFIEGFELRETCSHQFQRLEKSNRTHIASRRAPLFWLEHSHLLHASPLMLPSKDAAKISFTRSYR